MGGREKLARDPPSLLESPQQREEGLPARGCPPSWPAASPTQPNPSPAHLLNVDSRPAHLVSLLAVPTAALTVLGPERGGASVKKKGWPSSHLEVGRRRGCLVVSAFEQGVFAIETEVWLYDKKGVFASEKGAFSAGATAVLYCKTGVLLQKGRV